MNRIFKVGLLLLILGFIASTVFGLLSGTTFGSMYGDENYTYVKKTYAADQFEGIDASLQNKSVNIVFSASGLLEIEYHESDTNWIVVDESTGTLSLVNESKWYANFVVGLNVFNLNDYARVTIHLPMNTEYDLSIHTANGNIDISDYNKAKSIDFQTFNGEIELTNITASGSVQLGSSNGEIQATNVITPQTLDIDTLNGKIDLFNVSALEITCDTSNGSIYGKTIATDMLECQTANGNIEMDILGQFEDYHLLMTTDNGSYYLDGTKVTVNNYHTDVASKIQLSSINGNILINFIE